MLSDWYRDVVLALRALRKNPVLSLTAVLTLALGIGANTAIFTLLYGLVLRSLPTPDATDLVKIGIPSAAEPDSEENNAFMPYRMLQGLREEQSSFRGLSAWNGDRVLIKDKEGSVQGYLNVLHQKGEAQLNLYQRMVDRLKEMPAVDAAAATSQTPMTGEKIVADFQAVADGPNPPDTKLAYNDVGPGYFRTMKTRILAGREFEKNDRQLNVCILNQSAAAFFFPHEQAFGRYVRSKDSKEFPDPVACRVVGLAEDAKFSDIREGPPRTIYLPLSARRIDNLGNLVFLIHSRTKAEAVAAFRKTLAEVAPTVPLVIFVTLREQMDAALGSQELITLLANFFGVLALLLSALGLYALLSAGLAQRTSELGVRMVLGATRGMVLRMVLREALGLLTLGLLLGAIALLFTTRFVVTMLYGVSAYDPSTLAGVAGTLVIVTVLAATVPALRAATTDPIEALRAD